MFFFNNYMFGGFVQRNPKIYFYFWKKRDEFQIMREAN